MVAGFQDDLDSDDDFAVENSSNQVAMATDDIIVTSSDEDEVSPREIHSVVSSVMSTPSDLVSKPEKVTKSELVTSRKISSDNQSPSDKSKNVEKERKPKTNDVASSRVRVVNNSVSSIDDDSSTGQPAVLANEDLDSEDEHLATVNDVVIGVDVDVSDDEAPAAGLQVQEGFDSWLNQLESKVC